jgi:hypothetical protein
MLFTKKQKPTRRHERRRVPLQLVHQPPDGAGVRRHVIVQEQDVAAADAFSGRRDPCQ